MYFRLAPAQAAELADASELMLYPGATVVSSRWKAALRTSAVSYNGGHLARAGHRWENFLAKMQQDCPHLAMRLAGAEPLLAKPIAITHIPYGYIRRTTKDGLYCIGDQAAVTPRSPVTAYLSRCIPHAVPAAAYLCSRAGTALPG